MNTPTLVLGVIGADCHSVGNKILDAFLSERGFRVVNLGVMVGQDQFLDAAVEAGAQAILVSSLYGHAEIDCCGFRDRCTQRGLKDILLYIGGNLAVGKKPRELVERKFKALGFDRVFMAGDDLELACSQLKADLEERTRREGGSPHEDRVELRQGNTPGGRHGLP